ncbi:MAG: hypothetical protein K6F34_07375 [Lachnospiraceae bacterium]|nr:hypothetical protein [Lachnospiraceae bacterium]
MKGMIRITKRFTACMLAAAMVLTALPGNVFAAGITEDPVQEDILLEDIPLFDEDIEPETDIIADEGNDTGIDIGEEIDILDDLTEDPETEIPEDNVEIPMEDEADEPLLVEADADPLSSLPVEDEEYVIDEDPDEELLADDDAITFGVDLDDCTMNVNVKGAVLRDNTWTLPKTTKNFTYTLETFEEYVLDDVKLKGDDNTTVITIQDPPVINKTGDGLLYTFSANAQEINGKTLTADAKESRRKVYVHADNLDVSKTSVKINGCEADYAYDYYNNEIVVETEYPFLPVTVTAAAAAGYKLGSKAGITPAALIGDGIEKVVTPKNGTVTIANLAQALWVTVDFKAEANPGMTVSIGDKTTTYDNKAALTYISPDSEPVIKIYKGDDMIAVDQKDVTVSPATAGLVKEISEGAVPLDPLAVKDGKERKITITVKDPDNENKKLKFEVSLSVRQPLANVKIKGEIADKNDNTKSTIKQSKGLEEKSYALTADKSMNLNDLYATVAGGTCANAYIENGFLYISTCNGDNLPTDNFTVSLREKDNDENDDNDRIVKTVTVDVSDPVVLKEPAITVTKATDTDITVRISLPKGAEDYKNIWCFTEATAVGEPDPKMEEEDSYFGAFDQGTFTYSFDLDIGNMPGDGAEQAYDITATLYQTSDNEWPDMEDNTNITATGKTKTLAKQKTKNPNIYESKLTLTKKKTAFYQGESDVIAAEIKFSKDTSVTAAEAWVIDKKGNQYDASVDNGDGVSVILEDTDSFAPGPATLYVAPSLPDATYVVPATLTLTVNPSIYDIDFLLGDPYLYKQDGKAGSVTLTTISYDSDYNLIPKPKIKWTVEFKKDDSPLKGHVSVKNGVVTVDKDAVLSSNDNLNEIIVRACADDHEGNTEYESTTVYVENNPVRMNGLIAKKKTDSKIWDLSSVNPDDLLYGYVYFAYNGYELDPADYRFTVKGSGLTIDEEGRVTDITKPGTFTFSGVANDGSKNKCTATLTIADPGNPQYMIFGDTGKDDFMLDKDNNTATVNNASNIRLSLFRTDCILPVSEKITVKNGSIVQNSSKREDEVGTPYGNRYKDRYVTTLIIAPDAKGKDVEINVGDKKYTIKNSLGAGKLTPPKNLDFIADKNTDEEYTLYFISDTELPEGAKLFATPNTAYSKAKTDDEKENWEKAANYISGGTLSYDKKSLKIKKSFDGVAAGTYKVDVSVFDGEDNPLAKPVTITLKFKAAAKPKAALKDTKNILVEDKEDAKSDPLAFKTTSFYNIDSVCTLNDNNKGSVNDFASLFNAELDDTEGCYMIKLIRTGEVYTSNLSPGDRVNITGWIQYDIYGNDGVTKETIREKVTVTLVGASDDD